MPQGQISVSRSFTLKAPYLLPSKRIASNPDIQRHEKSVLILVLIVVVFLASHSFRLGLQSYQVREEETYSPFDLLSANSIIHFLLFPCLHLEVSVQECPHSCSIFDPLPRSWHLALMYHSVDSRQPGFTSALGMLPAPPTVDVLYARPLIHL